jgi:hypothetical protein
MNTENPLIVHLVMDARSGILGVFQTEPEADVRLQEAIDSGTDLGYFKRELGIPFLEGPL